MGVIIDIGKMDLDNSIQLVPASGANPQYYAADNGVVRSEFYELGNRVVFKRNNRSFSWTPDSMRYVDEGGMEDTIYTVQDVPLETKANYARFNRAFPDVDDWFQVNNSQLKHTILLQGFQRDPLPWLTGNVDFVFGGRIEFDADLRVLANGLVITGAFETSEGIEIIDPDGNVLFTLPQIVVYDSGIPDRAMTYGKYRVNSNTGGVLAFDIVVDNAWISSVERVYPIVIDPTVVVASAYNTANGNRSVLNLSASLTVVGVVNGSTVLFYKSTDSGTTWVQLCTISVGFVTNYISMINVGTVVYVLVPCTSMITVPLYKFDAATQTNVAIAALNSNVGASNGNTVYSVAAGAALTLAPDGHFTAFYSFRTTSSGSDNLYYAKSIDSGVTFPVTGSVWLAGSGGFSAGKFAAAVKSNNAEVIVFESPQSGTTPAIETSYWNGSSFTGNLPISSFNTLAQVNGAILVKKNGSNIGRIWVVWEGTDTTLTLSKNIRGSYSDDGCATFTSIGNITALNSSSNNMQNATIAEHTNGDIYIFYRNDFNNQVEYRICANGTTSFGTNVALGTGANGGTNPRSMDLTSNSFIGVMYMAASQVVFDKISFNVAPNAPTLTTKANFDATASAAFAWTFSDPDAGNTQSAFQLIIIKVSDGSTALDTGKVVSTSSTYTLTAATLTNNNQYQWKVRTYDQGDLVGPYSSLSSFYASAKPTTTITVPVSDATVVTTSSLTANWTYSDPESEASSAYEVKLTTSADVVLYDSGKVTATSVTALTIAYTLANSTSYKVKVTTWDAKDIASAEAVRTFVTSFTSPKIPTVALTAQSGYILATINNPVGNLLPDFMNPACVLGTTSGAIVTAPYAISVNPASAAVASNVTYTISVLPNTTYTVTMPISTNGQWAVNEYNSSGVFTGTSHGWFTVSTQTLTFTTVSTCVQLTIYTGNVTSSYTVTNPQLELGSTATTFDVKRPFISYNDLYRRPTGTTAYIRIATAIANNGTYSDYATASGTTYEYKVTAIGNNGTSADSATTSQSITLHCVYLFDVASPATTIRRYALDGKGRNASFTPNVTMLQFAGRTRPIAEYGENAAGKISVQLDMMRDSGDMEALRALMLRNATICYRDNRSRKSFCVITSLPETDVPMLGYYTTLELVEISFNESV